MLGKVEKVNVKWSFKTRFWKNEMERNSDEQKQIYGNYIQHHFWITVCYTWMNLNGGIYLKRCTWGLLWFLFYCDLVILGALFGNVLLNESMPYVKFC